MLHSIDQYLCNKHVYVIVNISVFFWQCDFAPVRGSCEEGLRGMSLPEENTRGEQWMMRAKPYHVPNSSLIFFRLKLDMSNCKCHMNSQFAQYIATIEPRACVWQSCDRQSRQQSGGSVRTQERHTGNVVVVMPTALIAVKLNYIYIVWLSP